MAEIKLQKIWVLGSEPLKGYTAEYIRELLNRYEQNDEVLATIMAGVSNRVGWIGHSIDDSENDEEVNNRIIEEYDKWCGLETELYQAIICKLQSENDGKQMNDSVGVHFVIRPLMERYGFEDCNGWWLKARLEE